MSAAAWFSTLGEPLSEAEHADIAAYLAGLSMAARVHAVSSWKEAGAMCAQPADTWWNAEERERARLEERTALQPADAHPLSLNEALHGAAAVAGARGGCTDPALIRAAAGAASHAAYQARLAQAAGAPVDHPFLRKYALYCGGRWPLGVYGGRFAIF